jgi:ATPase subunit of ABC transporter with duplicated ATPase domains
MSSIVCADLSFTWPDGTSVFDGLDLAIGPGRIGLVAPNGTGKSTLLRLIAGRLKPTRGSVMVTGRLGYLPQDVPLRASLAVDEVLGISRVRRALAAVESGDPDPAHLAAIGDDWDVEDRARATLDRLGLGQVHLDRTIGSVSGGEAMLVALTALLLDEPDVLLLDEPTNNLDIDARQRLYRLVAEWSGTLVVVSHDRALLELVDQIVDIGTGTPRLYGGNFTAYQEALAAEQQAAERAVRTAEADVRRQQRELIEARTKLDRRLRTGRKQTAEARFPKIVANERKRQAQVSAGKLRQGHEADLAAAREALDTAQEAVRDDPEIRVDLPGTQVPAGRTVLRCEAVRTPWLACPVDLEIRGPERIGLVGANGSGKTTLLRLIAGDLRPDTGTVRRTAAVGYLPQRLDILDDRLSVLDNVRRRTPAGDLNAIRAKLARLLFRGTAADQVAGTLSGGERFRAALAVLLCAEPPPQLLLLDEPTNNLDLASVRQIEQALRSYRGALIVASHDLPFLVAIGITRRLPLQR